MFYRKDNLDDVLFIEEAVKIVADYFSQKKDSLESYCMMLSASAGYWDDSGLNERMVNRWATSFKRKFSENDENDIDILVDGTVNAFKKCENSDELHKLRGHLFEAIIMGIYGGTDNFLNAYSYTHGWGAQVNTVDQSRELIPVKYSCSKKLSDDCEGRVTIDIAYWNAQVKQGSFYECKITPRNFGCKEYMYMAHLKQRVDNLGNITYYLASPHKEHDFKVNPLFTSEILNFGIESIIASY